MGKFTLVFVIFLVIAAQSAEIVLHDREKRCVFHHLATGSPYLLSYELEGGSAAGLLVDVEARTPADSVLSSKSAVSEGNVAFTADEPGEYSICFVGKINNGGRCAEEKGCPTSLVFRVQHGAELEAARKSGDKHDTIEREIQRSLAIVNGMIGELHYLKEREERMRDTNESTNARVMWFSVLSISILLAMGIWQIRYLNRFFAEKKLI